MKTTAKLCSISPITFTLSSPIEVATEGDELQIEFDYLGVVKNDILHWGKGNDDELALVSRVKGRVHTLKRGFGSIGPVAAEQGDIITLESHIYQKGELTPLPEDTDEEKELWEKTVIFLKAHEALEGKTGTYNPETGEVKR